MSTTIEERVASLRFDNRNFESNVKDTIKQLDKLDEKLNFKDAKKGIDEFNDSVKKFDMHGVVDGMTSFANASVGYIAKMTLVQKYTRMASDAVENLIKTVSGFSDMDAGMNKYSMMIKSTQTIMAATGKTSAEVDKSLERLSYYTDMTSYDFSAMVNTIGKFTSVGVELEDAITAMMGIGNEAARSGAGIAEANRTMYNLAQALATGSVKLIDWKSVEQAGMGTKEFKEQLIETAKALGVLDETGRIIGDKSGTIVNFKSFQETLAKGWLNSDVLIKTLKKYGDTTTEIGKVSYEAAKRALTFEDAMNAVKDAASSGWMQSFKYVFGNLEEAADLFTELCDSIINVMNISTEARNNVLSNWYALGGRTKVLEGIRDIWESLVDIAESIKRAFLDAFYPPVEKNGSLLDILHGIQDESDSFVKSSHLLDISNWVKTLGENLKRWLYTPAENGRLQITNIREAFQGFASVISFIGNVVGTVLGKIGDIFGLTAPVWDWLIVKFGDAGTAVSGFFGKDNGLSNTFDTFVKNMSPAVDSFKQLWESVKGVFSGISESLGKTDIGAKIKEKFDSIMASIRLFFNPVKNTKSIEANNPGEKIAKWFDKIRTDLLDSKVIERITLKLQMVLTWFATTWDKIKKTASNVWQGVTGFFSGLFGKDSKKETKAAAPKKDSKDENVVLSWIKWFEDLGKKISAGFNRVKTLWGKIKEKIAPFTKIISDFFSDFFNFDKFHKESTSQATAKENLSIFERFEIWGKAVSTKCIEIFNKAEEYWEKAKTKAVEIWDKIKTAIGPVIDFLRNLFGGGEGDTKKTDGVIKDISKYPKLAKAALSDVGSFNSAKNDTTKSFDIIGGFFTTIGNAFTNIVNAVTSIDWFGLIGQLTSAAAGIGGVFAIFMTGLGINQIGKGVKELPKAIKKFRLWGEGPEDDSIGATVMKFAKALAVVVGAFILIASLPANQIYAGLTAMMVIIAGLVAAGIMLTQAQNKFGETTIGKDLLMLSGAIVLLAGTMAIVGKYITDGEFFTGFGYVLATIMLLSGLQVALSALKKKGLVSFDISKNLIQLSAAISILVVLSALIGKMNPKVFFIGLGYVTAVTALIVAFIWVFALINKKVKDPQGINKRLIRLSVSIGILAGICELFGSKTFEERKDGLKFIGAVMALIVAFMGLYSFVTKKLTPSKLKGLAGIITSIGFLSIAIASSMLMVTFVDPVKIAVFGSVLTAVLFMVSRVLKYAHETKTQNEKNKINTGAIVTALFGMAAITVTAAWAVNTAKDVSFDRLLSFGAVVLAAGACAALVIAVSKRHKDSKVDGKAIGGIATALVSMAVVVAAAGLGISQVQDVTFDKILAFGAVVAAVGIAAALVVAVAKNTDKSKVSGQSIAAIAVVLAGMAAVVYVIGIALDKAKDVTSDRMYAFAAVVVAVGVAGALIAKVTSSVNISVGAIAKFAAGIAIFITALGIALAIFDATGGAAIESFTGRMERMGWNLEEFSNSCKKIDTQAVSNVTKVFEEMSTAYSKLNGVDTAVMLQASIDFAQVAANLSLAGIESAKISIPNIVKMSMALGLIKGMAETNKDLSVSELLVGTNGITRLGSRLKLFSENAAGINMDNLSKPEAVTGTIKKLYDNLKDVKDLGDMSTAIGNIGGAIRLYYQDIDGITFSSENTPDGETVSNVFDTLANNLPSKESRDKIIEFGKSLGETNSNGITDFAIGITNLGTAIAGYSTALGEGQIATAEKITASLTAIAALNDNLTGVGITEITAFGVSMKTESPQTKLSQFAEDVTALGSAMASFGKAMSNKDIDATKMKAGVDALVAIGGLANNTIDISSFTSFAGDAVTFTTSEGVDLDKFPGQIELLGTAVASFARAMGADDVDLEKLKKGVDITDEIASMHRSMPVIGGMQGLFGGQKDLGTFATWIGNLGKGISAFMEGVNAQSDYSNAEAAVNAIKVLAEAQSTLKETGGLGSLFSGTVELGDFATKMGNLGEGIASFVKKITGVRFNDNVVNAAESVMLLAQAQAYALSASGTSDMVKEDFIKFADGLLAFDDALSGRKISENTTAFVALADALGKCGKTFGDENTKLYDLGSWLQSFSTQLETVNVERISQVATDLSSIANMFYGTGEGAGTSLLAGLADGIQNGTDFVSTMVQPIVDAINTKQPDFVTAGSFLVQGLNVGINNATWSKTNSPIKSAEQLAKLCIAAIEDTWVIRSPSHIANYEGTMFVLGLNEGIVKLGPRVVHNVAAIATDVVKTAQNILNSAPIGLSGIIKNFSKSSKDIQTTTEETTNNIIKTFNTAGNDFAKEIQKQNSGKKSKNLLDILADGAEAAGEKITEVTDGIKTAVTDAVSSVGTMVEDGIKQGKGWASAIGGFGKKVVDSVGNLNLTENLKLGDIFDTEKIKGFIDVSEKLTGVFGDAFKSANEKGDIFTDPAGWVKNFLEGFKNKGDLKEARNYIKEWLGLDDEQIDLMIGIKADDPDGIIDKLTDGSALSDIANNTGSSGGGSGSGSGSRSYKGSMQGEGLSFDYAKRFAGQLASGNLAIGVGTGEYTLADVLARMDLMQQAIENMQVVLDTGVIAGGLTTQIDKNLGRQVALNGRGV